MNRAICAYVCEVNGCLGSQVMCGFIKVGDDAVCGAPADHECEHKVLTGDERSQGHSETFKQEYGALTHYGERTHGTGAVDMYRLKCGSRRIGSPFTGQWDKVTCPECLLLRGETVYSSTSIVMSDSEKPSEVATHVSVPVTELCKLEECRIHLYHFLETKLNYQGMHEFTTLTGQIWMVANRKDWS